MHVALLLLMSVLFESLYYVQIDANIQNELSQLFLLIQKFEIPAS